MTMSFNTQPPEGGCANEESDAVGVAEFQHTAARRRLLLRWFRSGWRGSFNTQPPEGGCPTRSAGSPLSDCFNTQPPEGGCRIRALTSSLETCFNTQPPEGGCARRHRAL